MSKAMIGMLMACSLGCAATAAPTLPKAPDAGAPVTTEAPTAAMIAAPSPADSDRPAPSSTWIGASGASDFVLSGTSETILGVWVDVPSSGAHKGRAPAAVSLVVDTSGSMSGEKMQSARNAARAFVNQLADGDIVSIHSFDDTAIERVPPTTLSGSTRPMVLRAIDGLSANGSTNLFDGLRLGESRVFNSPATHAVRRVVLISDGIATVGPSSAEILGQVAARGAESGVQVTALGVGLDYDERTLNALAVRSSGRLYHIGEPRELSAMLERETSLLQATAATGAFVEIVPAPGVQLLGADGVRFDWAGNGAVRVPLGTMFGGQHRELLVRVRVNATGDGSRPLASVRLHFNDPSDGNLERVQEVVARYQVTGDRGVVASHENAKTRAIAATQEAAQATIVAAQQLNDGRFDVVEKDLARAEQQLRASAAQAAADDQKRILAQATKIAQVRASAKAAAAAPAAAAPAMRRARALDANKAGMEAMGY